VLTVKREISVHVNELPCVPDDAPVELRSSSTHPLIVDPEQRAVVEHFGVLRARLLNARNKSGIRSVLISSPQRQDGKTFTALNLAISLAQLQQIRVLLVDGDLRLKGITRNLGLEERTGLADFLQDWASFQDCIKRTTLPHLSIAPTGSVSAELLPAILEGARWPNFIEKGKQEFDLVIVDSVPVSVPIADFELLLNACDTSLLVVHVRKTTREAMNLTMNRMQGKLLGVVVNNKEIQKDYDYSPYGK
jgi:capsular exopolysaccharide synthesis family protein